MLYNYKNARITSKQTVRNLKIHLQVNVNKITHQNKTNPEFLITKRTSV